MNTKNIFEIENLTCSYSKEHEQKVLYIENLKLQSGKIIFLIGASGSGKSTLLETLGLMNDTIVSGNVKLIVDDKNNFEFTKLWNSNKEEEINKVRKNFLSFIFQNTNLMENFTAYENICLSQMIKSNAVQDNVMKSAVELMNQVGLPQSQVAFDKLSVNLSGGQRQRVSFVRALNTDFKVLLCDEPTGNLDEINAHELLKIVKENLSSDKTAIIVSHDISLALKYADEIIVITKNNEKGYGEVLPANTFSRTQWENLNQIDLLNFRQLILNYFPSDKESKTLQDPKNSSIKFSKNYKDLFIKKEGKVLFGKSYVNLLILISIIFITFISIGFANGTLQYLERKLNDPFVNWLTVGIPWSKSSASSVDDFKDKLNSNKNLFLIDTVTSYKETSLPLFKNNSEEVEFSKGRLLTFDDPITKDLFGKENYISGDLNFKDEQDLGIVVTEKLLTGLGYPIYASVIYLSNDDVDTTSTPHVKFKVPIPIRAVLKNIPGRNKFLITNYFFGSFLEHDQCVFDFREQRKRIIFYVDGDKKFCNDLKNDIQGISKSFNLTELKPKESFNEEFNSDEEDYDEDYDSDEEENSNSDVNYSDTSLVVKDEYQTLEFDIAIDTCEVMKSAGYELSINFDALPYNYTTTERIVKQISNLTSFKKNRSKITRIFDYNNSNGPELDFNNDFLCINFKKGGLDSIDSFSRYVYKELNTGREKEQNNVIEVDSASIKEKKNFNYISKITYLITALLILFAILTIILFISNLLKTHLSKVQMNLGTYKAFGLSNSESKSIYLVIMLRFIFIGVAVSLVLANIVGGTVEYFLRQYVNIEDEINYFLLNDIKSYLLLVVIILVTISASYYNVNKALSKTPGDLIYNR